MTLIFISVINSVLWGHFVENQAFINDKQTMLNAWKWNLKTCLVTIPEMYTFNIRFYKIIYLYTNKCVCHTICTNSYRSFHYFISAHKK